MKPKALFVSRPPCDARVPLAGSDTIPAATAKGVPQARGYRGVEQSRRCVFADVIRALAIVLVIVLHVAAYPVLHFQRLDRGTWWLMDFVDSFARPAVPLFVMISGMLLLDPGKREGVWMFFRKRVKRIAIPFLGWAAIYMGWRMTYHGETIGWLRAAREIVQGPVYAHFWFMYVIIGLYILTPILRTYMRHATAGIRRYSVAVWFVFAAVLPTMDHAMGLRLGVYQGSLQYVGYFMLGFMLREFAPRRNLRQWLLVLVAAMAAVTAIGTYLLASADAGVVNELFYNGVSPNVIVMSVALFLVMKSADYRGFFAAHPASLMLVGWISSASFTIYFCHPIFIELLQGGLLGFRLEATTLTPLIGLPATTLAVLALSCLLTYAIRPIPVLGRIAY